MFWVTDFWLWFLIMAFWLWISDLKMFGCYVYVPSIKNLNTAEINETQSPFFVVSIHIFFSIFCLALNSLSLMAEHIRETAVSNTA